ncbi:MAG TPA: hypothetical protein VFM18_20735 [Methanosarcina sp.]|nr:hypothetical protein [Methanosarcina sp.]
MNKTEYEAYLAKHRITSGTWCDKHPTSKERGGSCSFVELVREEEYMICPECKTIYPYWISEK